MSCVENQFAHEVGAYLDYGFDYATLGWLETGETIVDSVWTVSDDTATLTDEQNLDGVTSVFVSGCVHNKVYYLKNTVTTNSVPPRTDIHTIILTCQ